MRKITLELYRKEALMYLEVVDYTAYSGIAKALAASHTESQERILELTQALLDLLLIKAAKQDEKASKEVTDNGKK